MKVTHMLMLAGISVVMLAACGNGNKSGTDSTVNTMDTAGMIQQDTVPAAQMPPGAINPGEDSSRFGTGAADSSKNRPRP
ncbi:ABC-type glycerol-3-phosphate transport system substrate-binding protein [Chitinophaga sp. W3I9]|uniref:hypothetical protein n=1 Tax=unclassified Chitinophaga TaxID=2619133 RepID=UPI003D1F8FAB